MLKKIIPLCKGFLPQTTEYETIGRPQPKKRSGRVAADSALPEEGRADLGRNRLQTV